MTEVIGRPPTRPDSMFPAPWAISSLFVGEKRCRGSSLSTASRFRSVSRDATSDKVTAAAQMAGSAKRLKSGWTISSGRDDRVFTTGTLTRWSSPINQGPPSLLNKSARAIPNPTTTNGPGSLERTGIFTLSQATRTNRDITPITAAPPCQSPRILINSVKVFSLSGWLKAISPSGSGSWPSRWGNCFRIRMRPIADSRPWMTLEGKKEAMNPARHKPKATCIKPAITTASRKPSSEPSVAICAATTAVRPAAGPLTLVWDPLRKPTTTPPMMPAMRPEIGGAPEARATPRHRGKATRKTTMLATRSRERDWALKLFPLVGARSSNGSECDCRETGGMFGMVDSGVPSGFQSLEDNIWLNI